MKLRKKPSTDIDNLNEFDVSLSLSCYRSIIEFIYTSDENKANKRKTTMSDLLDDDLEFRGGTLQLSTEHLLSGGTENTQNNGTETSGVTTHMNPNMSVLSGVDSLSSSTSSFIGEQHDSNN